MNPDRKQLISQATAGLRGELVAGAMRVLRAELVRYWPDMPPARICALGLIKGDGGVRVFLADGTCGDLDLDAGERAGVLAAAAPVFLLSNAQLPAVT